MIQLSNLSKVFNQNKPNEFTAIKGIDLTIESLKMTVLKGPSGSGKTTLLSLIGCMARPTTGRIHLNGREITSLPERFLTEIRRSTYGFMFQQPNLIKGISALENIMIPAFPIGEKFSKLKDRAHHLLEIFNLSEKKAAKIEWLSGGEAQRVTIARALMNNPTTLIADEPTAHLDTQLSKEFMQIMSQLKMDGKTIIIASHDPLVCEHDAVDDVIEMRDGEVVASQIGT